MLHELNSRDGNGISVALLWDDSDDACFIEVETETEWNRFQVPRERASDAFAHPFCYLFASIDRETMTRPPRTSQAV